MNALAASFLLLVTLVAAPVSALPLCPCTCPGDVACPSACSACATQLATCDCETGCGAAQCPDGYTPFGFNVCVPSVNTLCRKICVVQTAQCAACAPHHYGPACDACPGGTVTPCSGNGTCSEGLAGDGSCTCHAGFAGPVCQYGNATTCNGHGNAAFDGTCACDAGFTGADCSTPITTTTTTIPACDGDDVPALICVLDVPPGECAGEPVPDALQQRLDRSRRALGRAADATAARRARFLRKAAKQLGVAVRLTAKADRAGTLSDGCAVVLSEQLAEARAQARDLASPN